jgi:hypothetical protein
MLNISKEQKGQLAVIGTYVLLLLASPLVLAAARADVTAQPDTVNTVEVNPLVEFKDAKSLDGAELKELLKAVGFEGKALKTAWAVAMKESNGRPIAHNDNTNTGDNSYGLFQINMIGGLGIDRREKFNLLSNRELFDPVTNAQIAYHMSDGGKDWSSWKIKLGQENGERFEEFLKQFPNI